MSSYNHTKETKHSLDNVKSEEIYNFAFGKKVTEKNSSINYCIISKKRQKNSLPYVRSSYSSDNSFFYSNIK